MSFGFHRGPLVGISDLDAEMNWRARKITGQYRLEKIRVNAKRATTHFIIDLRCSDRSHLATAKSIRFFYLAIRPQVDMLGITYTDDPLKIAATNFIFQNPAQRPESQKSNRES
jgi:hypothetical protein